MKNFRTMMNYARQKKQIGADVLSENVKIIPTFCLLFFHFSALKIL